MDIFLVVVSFLFGGCLAGYFFHVRSSKQLDGVREDLMTHAEKLMKQAENSRNPFQNQSAETLSVRSFGSPLRVYFRTNLGGTLMR